MQPTNSGAVTIYPPTWEEADSYGHKAIELCHHLRRRGVSCNAPGLDKHALQWTAGGVLMGYPTDFYQFGWLANAGPRVVITAWESTQLPPGWVEALNACGAVSVGSPFTRDVLLGAGVTVAVQVDRLGVSDVYQFVERSADRPFTFLAFGDRDDRKGRQEAVHAFVNAFGQSMDVRLIVKARTGKIKPLANPNIEVIAEDYTLEQMAALYQRCDCLVFPSYGEGFGLPPREFAATGGLVIATAWSGTADHIDEWGEPLSFRLAPAWQKKKEFRGLSLGEWAKPDVDHLIALMRQVALLPLDERNRIGKQRAERVRCLYSWERFASGIYSLWGKVGEYGR